VLGLTLVTAQAAVLENANLAIEIDDASYAVRSIMNKKAGGVKFVEPTTNAVLWTAEFRAGSADVRPVELTSASPCRKRRIERTADGGATLVWEGLDLGDEHSMVTVRAVVRFVSDGSSKWTLDIQNKSLRRGLFATRYPILPQLVGDGMADCLLPRSDVGARLMRGMKRGKDWSFGCMGYSPMMVAFLKGDAGLYIAAHDGTSRIKTLEVDKELGVSFSTPTENGGVAGLAANGPCYETTVAAFKGDWWEAARMYRAWALTTRWTAKGPIISRTDYPKRMAEIPVWLNIHGSPAEVSNVMTRARAVFPNFDCGIHWHVWQHSKHDINYPEYFPEQEGAGACFAYLKSIGEEALPYTNGRLWSTNLVSYPYVLPYVCKKPDGSPYVEQYGKVTPPMSPMCPYTVQWNQTVNDFSSRVLSLGANSIFLDQIGACSARTCYDVNHGHPVGGGTWYFDGYQSMLAKTHALYSSKGAFITTEGSGEEWMNVVDGYLCVTQRQPDDVPFFHAVYNGYTTYFCSPENQDDDFVSFRAAQTRELLWGQALGWYHPLILDQPDKCALLRKLGEFRQANLDFFAYGTLAGEVKFKGNVPPVKLAWLGRKPFYMWAFKDFPLSPTIRGEMPSVFGYVWKSAEEGRTVAFLANVGDEACEVSFEFGGKSRRRTIQPGEIVVDLVQEPHADVDAVLLGIRPPRFRPSCT
ncbi:MAG: hypothetical protein KBT68_07095, partial [bacterium]|nr:hypothetical protein [Candidatus Colisoma equi]